MNEPTFEELADLEQQRKEAAENLKRLDEWIAVVKQARREAFIANIQEQIKDEGIEVELVVKALGGTMPKTGKTKTTTTSTTDGTKPRASKPRIFRDPKTGEEISLTGSWKKWVTGRIEAGASFEELVIDKNQAEELKARFEEAKSA